MLEKDTHH